MADIDTSNMSEEEIAELQKQNCIFCKIASKQIPAKILHEDDKVICVLDINPASEGHILVYPKEHYMILPHIPDDLLAHLFKVTQLMSKTLLKALQTGGTSVFIANGMAAGQKAPHVLIHVFPRKMNDGLLKLPRYDMTDDQKKKLKSTLKPYFNQIFGSEKIEKIDRKNELSIKEKDKKNELSGEELKEKDSGLEIDKEKARETQENKTVHKKKENTKKEKEEVAKEKKESSKKIDDKKNNENKEKNDSLDLDDIAKLFGG
jgi:histidine triad (HIT) family protein